MHYAIDKSRLLGVRQNDSPNQGDRPPAEVINLLVIHNISLPPGEFGTPCVEQLFSNSLNPDSHPYFKEIAQLRVSAHLFIARDGSVVQFVPFDKKAWHAGQSEFCGRSNCNDFSIGIELEGTDHVYFTDVQYTVLADVTLALMQAFPSLILERIVGHSDIAPGRKTDPGPCFDWNRYRSLLQDQIRT